MDVIFNLPIYRYSGIAVYEYDISEVYRGISGYSRVYMFVMSLCVRSAVFGALGGNLPSGEIGLIPFSVRAVMLGAGSCA